MERLTIADCETMVRGPGKFEGEARYVPYFWELVLDGSGKELGRGVVRVQVTPSDRELFPELRNRRSVRLVETDNGFVCEV